MTAAQPAPHLDELHSELEQKVADEAQRLQVPGVAVGIYRNGSEDYACYGVTSIENPLPVDEHTLFQIGSTGKTYTATVLMILQEQGRVDLTAPVRTYIPELRLKDASVAERVTVLQLLNHTAGWAGDIMRDTGDGDDALARFVAELATVDQVNPLGSIASYNNAALSVAGRVIEKVTGKTYEAAVKDMLLDPLGLDKSYFFVKDVITRRFVVGHEQRDGRLQVARPWSMPRNSNPAGGIIAPVTDQVRYARFHLGDGTGKDGVRVLSRDSVERMREPTVPFGEGHVGISWMIQDVGGVRTVGHGGSTPGQQTDLLLVPERDFAVTILTNAMAGLQLISALEDWILDAYLGVVRPKDEPLPLTPEELAVYEGSYDGVLWIADLRVENDYLRLTMRFTEQGLAEIRAAGMDEPQWTPARMKILPRERFIILDGEYAEMTGGIIREGDRVQALDLGRIAHRIPNNEWPSRPRSRHNQGGHHGRANHRGTSAGGVRRCRRRRVPPCG